MSDVADVIEEVIAISAEIRELDLEIVPMRERMAQIEVKRVDLKNRLVSLIAGRNGATNEVPSRALDPPPARKKRPFANTGFIRTLLDFLEAHPNQQVTPESVASAIGHPDKTGLAATCLKRLWDAKKIDKPRTGHYVFRGPVESYLPPKQPKEPVMT